MIWRSVLGGDGSPSFSRRGQDPHQSGVGRSWRSTRPHGLSANLPAELPKRPDQLQAEPLECRGRRPPCVGVVSRPLRGEKQVALHSGPSATRSKPEKMSTISSTVAISDARDSARHYGSVPLTCKAFPLNEVSMPAISSPASAQHKPVSAHHTRSLRAASWSCSFRPVGR